MPRIVGPLLACILALANVSANAIHHAARRPLKRPYPRVVQVWRPLVRQLPTADDICRALEHRTANMSVSSSLLATRHSKVQIHLECLSHCGAEDSRPSRDRWDKIDTPRAILASLPPTTVHCAHAREA